MATIEEALVTSLTAHTGLSALVGTRIYSVRKPQSPTMPAITYQLVSEDIAHTISTDSGYSRPVFQFDIWAASYSSAKAVLKQLRLALINYTGGDASVDATLAGNTIDSYDDATKQYRIITEFEFFYGGV